MLGSRSAQRAVEAAAGPPGRVVGLDTAGAAMAGDVVVVAVPLQGHRDLHASLADPLAGKVVVDCVNPLGYDSRGAYALPVLEGSAAQQAAQVLPDSRVVAAFHHVSAVLLLDEKVDTSTPPCWCSATPRGHRPRAGAGGAHAQTAGRVRGAAAQRPPGGGLTANLISVNRRYKAHAGLRVTDV